MDKFNRRPDRHGPRLRQFKPKKFVFMIFLGIFLLVFVHEGLRYGTYKEDQGLSYSYDTPYTDPYKRISDIEELEPRTRELAYEFLARCQDQGLDVVIIETYRTQERQDMLYDQGRITEGQVVTWTRNSYHTKRQAFDIVKAGDDPYGDEDFFRRCAEIGEDLGLEAGYFWDVKDMGHFQYRGLF